MLADFLVAHGVDPAKWARRHRIEPFTVACPGCGRQKEPTLPMVASGGRYGLVAPRCPCGDPSDTYCIVGLFDRGTTGDDDGR